MDIQYSQILLTVWGRRHLERPLALIALSLLVASVYLPRLGYLPLYLEEPRRALIAVQMLTTGNYLTPIYEGHIYLGKPPLFNWLICIVSLPFGVVDAWSARLPSVLALWFLTIFLVSSVWQRIGAQGALFWGCALLLSPEILAKGQLAEIDLVFACLVTTAIWSWWLLDQAGWRGLVLWLPPLLFTTLAYLTKREPAVVFFYLTVGSYLIIQGRGRELITPAHCGAVLLAALPIGAWLMAIAAQVGWVSLWHSLLYEVLLRGDGATWGRYLKHLLSYPFQILGACAPFSLLLLPLSKTEFRLAVWTRYGAVAVFAVVAVLANLPLYWFKGHLAVRYFLPMFPFVLLLAALSYATLLAMPAVGNLRWRRYLLPGIVALMLLLRGLELVVYKPIKAAHLAQTQNASAIIIDVVRQLPPNKRLFASERIPSALWFYAPQGLLHILGGNTPKPINGDLILRHEAITLANFSGAELAQYRYENDNLRLNLVHVH